MGCWPWEPLAGLDAFARARLLGGADSTEVDHKCEFKYLVCNIYDATLKIIAVAKAKANIVIHICSSIAWQAGAQPVSQPPAPGLSSSRWTGPQPMIRAACA